MTDTSLRPNSRVPFVDNNGKLTSFGLRLLESIRDRTGGDSNAVASSNVEAGTVPISAFGAMQIDCSIVMGTCTPIDFGTVSDGDVSCGVGNDLV